MAVMVDATEVERLIRAAIAEAEDETTRLRGNPSRPLRPGSTRSSLVGGMANRAMGLYVALEIVQDLRHRAAR